MYESQNGKLWFGSVGIYDLEKDSWNLLHPDVDFAFKTAGHQGLYPPNISLESSDSVHWFHKLSEDMFTGTAWYDPESGEGCMFTHISAIVRGDNQEQLWMSTGADLYRYALED